MILHLLRALLCKSSLVLKCVYMHTLVTFYLISFNIEESGGSKDYTVDHVSENLVHVKGQFSLKDKVLGDGP